MRTCGGTGGFANDLASPHEPPLSAMPHMKLASKAYRDAARGQPCTLNIAGICSYNPDETVFAHFPDESHGMSRKSDDVSGGDACANCHSAIDGRLKYDFAPGEKDWYMRRSQNRTLRRRIEQGLLTLRGAA